jgi:hypothetical protein
MNLYYRKWWILFCAGYYQYFTNIRLEIMFTILWMDLNLTKLQKFILLPIFIDSTKVLRANHLSTGLLPSKTITNTYFINFSTTLTVVSLSTIQVIYLMKNMEFIRWVIVLRQQVFHTSVLISGMIGKDQFTLNYLKLMVQRLWY